MKKIALYYRYHICDNDVNNGICRNVFFSERFGSE